MYERFGYFYLCCCVNYDYYIGASKMKECINCKAMLEDDELFCHECGTKQEIEEPEAQGEEPVATEEMYCIHCGKAIEADSVFCPFCGKPQEVEEEKNEESQPKPAEPEPQQEPEKSEPKPEETEQSQAEEQKNAAPTQPEQPEQPKEEQPQAEETYEGEEKKKSKTLLYLLSGSDSDLYPAVEGDYIEEPTDSIPEDEEDVVVIDKYSVEGVQARLNDILSKALTMRDDDAIRAFFSEEYRILYFKVGEYDRSHAVPGFWNGNIWDGGQDGNPDMFAITRVSSPNDDKTNAGVKFVYDKDGPHSENLVNVELVFENDDWYIDDINAYKQGMRLYLEEMNLSSDEKETGNNSKISMAGKVSKYAIHMVLTINGTSVTGYYYYDSQGDGNRVTLNGSYIGDNLKLRKIDKDGEETGYFEGVFDGTNYEGKNVNYNRDEALPFFVEVVN